MSQCSRTNPKNQKHHEATNYHLKSLFKKKNHTKNLHRTPGAAKLAIKPKLTKRRSRIRISRRKTALFPRKAYSQQAGRPLWYMSGIRWKWFIVYFNPPTPGWLLSAHNAATERSPLLGRPHYLARNSHMCASVKIGDDMLISACSRGVSGLWRTRIGSAFRGWSRFVNIDCFLESDWSKCREFCVFF